jgi:hypothetical protein
VTSPELNAVNRSQDLRSTLRPRLVARPPEGSTGSQARAEDGANWARIADSGGHCDLDPPDLVLRCSTQRRRRCRATQPSDRRISAARSPRDPERRLVGTGGSSIDLLPRGHRTDRRGQARIHLSGTAAIASDALTDRPRLSRRGLLRRAQSRRRRDRHGRGEAGRRGGNSATAGRPPISPSQAT